MKIHLLKFLIIAFLPAVMPVVIWGTTALAQTAGGGASANQAAGQGWSENFENGVPSNWELFDGAGVIQSSQGNVLGFSSAGMAAWLVQPGSDYTLSFKILQGGGAPEIFLCHRHDPPDEQYYIVRLFPDEAEVVRYLGTQESSLGFTGGMGIGSGTWTSVEIAVCGNGKDISVSVGGQPLLTVQDPQPLNSGGISFRAVGEGGTEIDDITVNPGLTACSSSAGQPSN